MMTRLLIRCAHALGGTLHVLRYVVGWTLLLLQLRRQSCSRKPVGELSLVVQTSFADYLQILALTREYYSLHVVPSYDPKESLPSSVEGLYICHPASCGLSGTDMLVIPACPGRGGGAITSADLHRQPSGLVAGRLPGLGQPGGRPVLPPLSARPGGRRLLSAARPAAVRRQCQRLRPLRKLLPCSWGAGTRPAGRWSPQCRAGMRFKRHLVLVASCLVVTSTQSTGGSASEQHLRFCPDERQVCCGHAIILNV